MFYKAYYQRPGDGKRKKTEERVHSCYRPPDLRTAVWQQECKNSKCNYGKMTLAEPLEDTFTSAATESCQRPWFILLLAWMTVMPRVSVEIRASVTHPWQQRTSETPPAAGRPREDPFRFNFQEERSASLNKRKWSFLKLHFEKITGDISLLRRYWVISRTCISIFTLHQCKYSKSKLQESIHF